MATFYATLAYELHPAIPGDVRKLLVAEMAARGWLDKAPGGQVLPAGALWARRAAGPSESTDDVHRACAGDLASAAAAVERTTGQRVGVRRAWAQVAGAGTYGPLAVPAAPPGGNG
jgi:hypothetical protein